MHFDISKILNDVVSYIFVTVIGGLIAWIVTLRRKVNTNEKQIELMLADMGRRDKARDEDRDRMESLEQDIREVRQDVRDIKNALLGRG